MSASITLRVVTGFTQIEVARLAFMNWEHDGCPDGKDVDYWLEAESQLKATWHLLVGERPSPRSAGGKPGSPGLKARLARKISEGFKSAPRIKTVRAV